MWYEYKVSWNKIVKGIKILTLKGFGVIYVKSIVEEWCDIHRQYKDKKKLMQLKT